MALKPMDNMKKSRLPLIIWPKNELKSNHLIKLKFQDYFIFPISDTRKNVNLFSGPSCGEDIYLSDSDHEGLISTAKLELSTNTNCVWTITAEPNR